MLHDRAAADGWMTRVAAMHRGERRRVVGAHHPREARCIVAAGAAGCSADRVRAAGVFDAAARQLLKESQRSCGTADRPRAASPLVPMVEAVAAGASLLQRHGDRCRQVAKDMQKGGTCSFNT